MLLGLEKAFSIELKEELGSFKSEMLNIEFKDGFIEE